MLVDVKQIGLFEVPILRIVTGLDNQAIADYTLEHCKTWDRYTTYHDRALNARWQEGMPGKDKLEEAILEAGNEFVNRTGRKKFDEPPFMYYWCSVYNEGDSHGSHNHPNSLIAGTYWASAGDASSSLFMEAPWKSHIMHDNIPIGVFKYRPNAGDMLVWPSWIDHRVPTQGPSDVTRIAISFNLDYAKYHHD